MGKSEFVTKLEGQWAKGLFVCVGLDSDYARLPQAVKDGSSVEDAIFEFNRAIVDATADLVCAFKPQSSYYEEQGAEGWNALARTAAYINKNYPHIVPILDAKRGDIDRTSASYARSIFDNLGFGAVTVNPYFGEDALDPFLAYKNKGVIILVKTSNKGNGEFQDQKLADTGKTLYETVAERVATVWNKNGNCGVVVGATFPKELAVVRSIIGDIPILIPGLGAQDGDVEATIQAGRDSRGWGMIINSSSTIIFASAGEDFAEAARAKTEELHRSVLKYAA
ncbi:orotidine-5'-phosphate decarboxylase [Candidatus Daviesbacteria bacterium]|nr:orotidine-5'-phosphate decarboxylase [Candidatus Daviesbacteria bacterium]